MVHLVDLVERPCTSATQTLRRVVKVPTDRLKRDAGSTQKRPHDVDRRTNDLVPEKSLGYYGGGNPMLNLQGELVPSANITMDKTTGIGNWTRQQFLEAVKFGKSPQGKPLHYPMFPHTALTDTEVNAVYAYLQTVPPLQNMVARYQPKE